MEKRNFLTKGLFVIAAMTFMASCSKSTDLYDPSAIAEKQKFEQEVKLETAKTLYATNFEKKYGKISPDQTWDFTTGRKLGTRGVTSITTNYIDGLDFGVDNNNINKNNSIYDAIKEKLPEKEKHEGKPAVLVCPTSSFYIFPISVQGQWTHKLKVKVGDNDPVELYTKEWTDYSKPYVNGMIANSKKVDMKGLFIEAPVGTPIDVFIDNVKHGSSGKKSVGTSTGQAIYVDVPPTVTLDLPSNIKLNDGATIKYIGIEDNTEGNTDNDYNDIVLAVVGNPDIPEEVIITENEYEVPTYLAKRYMVEDLGATDDFDFNDIVIDVYQNFNEKHKVTFENGARKSDVITETVKSDQVAVIRAMGGTVDFTLKIGDNTWSKSGNGFDVTKMLNTQSIDKNAKLAEITVTGWDPDQNNVEVEVKDAKNNGVHTITFPKKGEAPMIIAVDESQEWMTERNSVPKAWFFTED